MEIRSHLAKFPGGAKDLLDVNKKPGCPDPAWYLTCCGVHLGAV